MESLELIKREGVEYPVFFLYKPLAGTDLLDRFEELGAHVLADSMGASADFLHGVNLEHEHIKAWQLRAYLGLTHVLFGPNLVLSQVRRVGWRYFPRLVRYVSRAMAVGFSFYGAFTYFIFYGYDHFAEAIRLRAQPRPGRAWRALMAVTRLWMRPSGAPEPPLVAAQPRPVTWNVDAAAELVPTGSAAQRAAGQPNAAVA